MTLRAVRKVLRWSSSKRYSVPSKVWQRCEGFDGTEYRFELDNLNTFRTALSVTFYF